MSEIHSSTLESVSSLVNRQHMPRIGGFLLEFAPEFGNVSIYRPTHHSGPMTPDLLKKFEAAGYGPIPTKEGQKQIKLLWRE